MSRNKQSLIKDIPELRKQLAQIEMEFVTWKNSQNKLNHQLINQTLNSYQELCSLYGILSTYYPKIPETQQAKRLVLFGRALIYSNKLALANRPRTAYLDSIRLSFQSTKSYILVAFLCFILGAFVAASLVYINPEYGWNFIDDRIAEDLSKGHLWTEKINENNYQTSLMIGNNNIKVSLLALAFGVTAGIGTFLVMFFNGWIIGGMLVHLIRYGMHDELLKFISAHGFLELSIIFIAGGCGLYLGDAIIHPSSASRVDSLRTRTYEVFNLIIFVVLCLVPCGFVEGYISPNPNYNYQTKLIVGVVLAVSLWSFLFSKVSSKARV